MAKNALKFLNKPYPFNDDLKHNAKIVSFISVGVLAFLFVFQPVDFSTLSNRTIFYLITGIAVSTFITLSLNLMILPSFLPKLFDTSKWNIKREIIWNIWILLAISSSDLFLYSKLFGIMNIDYSDILKIILLGFLPVIILITINQERLLRSHLQSAQQMNKKLLEGKQKREKLVHFESDYNKDSLIIKAGMIVFIKSADNYIEVYYDNDGDVKKQMIRSSLKQAEELLLEFDYILKCHRSFIVNVNRIKEIQGNSRGYKLFFENIDSTALVSQKYIPDFRKLI